MAITKCPECGGQVSDKAPACPSCGAPRSTPAGAARKTASGLWTAIKIFVALIFGVIVYQCTTLSQERSSQPQASRLSLADEAIAGAQRNVEAGAVVDCKNNIGKRRQQYDAFMTETRYHRAIEALGACPRLTPSPELTVMLRGAQLKMHLEAALDKARPIEDREAAMSILVRDFPEDAKPYAKLHRQLIAQRTKARERQQAQERAKRRREGVSIGMSKDDVLQSSWGKPRDVNRTTNQYGVREQWVYDGGYLYFRDGVLTSIQN